MRSYEPRGFRERFKVSGSCLTSWCCSTHGLSTIDADDIDTANRIFDLGGTVAIFEDIPSNFATATMANDADIDNMDYIKAFP